MNSNNEKIHILSRSTHPFADREQAGQALAEALSRYYGSDALVLGIPRGGVLVARALALELGLEYDIVLVRKIRSPWNEEYAVGAVGENGEVLITEHDYRPEDALGDYLSREIEHQKAEIGRLRVLYRKVRPKAAVENRTVIVADDGLATGATMQAALLTLRADLAGKLVVAVPVAPQDTLKNLAGLADELWCLRSPEIFTAVGQCYVQFEQVTDEQVMRALAAGTTVQAY